MRCKILTMNVDVTSCDKATEQIIRVASDYGPSYVCVSNVHMCMECFDSKEFSQFVNGAEFVVPDGKPLVWAQKIFGNRAAKQVRGMDLMLSLCSEAQNRGLSVGFYGSSVETLQRLELSLKKMFPDLRIGYSVSPPFRVLTQEENESYICDISASGVGILFVGLGCPKQETWMATYSSRLNCCLVGVGAAFDFIANNKKVAPSWIIAIGMEWFFRLLSEPRRLWKRYLINNPRFMYRLVLQCIRGNIDND